MLQIGDKQKKCTLDLQMSEKRCNFAEQNRLTAGDNRMTHTILIVDDEQDIREILAFNLETAGYRCLSASCGAEALDLIAHQAVDLVLLDVMMPDMSGFEVAQQIKDIPVIFLTALGEEEDILRGFSLGADDYIAKPFSIKEVLARVKRTLERGSQPPLPSSEAGGLVLDDRTYMGTIDGEDLGLTKMEYELLHFMLHHQGVVFSRTDLLSQVWPDNGIVLERTVDVTITRLRKKIGTYKYHLKTKMGYGYYWEK